jgi:CRP/FNR family cyclic AMP-dependent transcriptional regulator
VLVALQGPLIVMSQNRQAFKDRATAETDFKVNLKNELNIETILRELGEFRAESNARLEVLEQHVAGPDRLASPAPTSLTRAKGEGQAPAGESRQAAGK